MSTTHETAMRILAKPGSDAFDDIGALVTALCSMLDSAGDVPAAEARHLYVLSVMAASAWKKLDDAMRANEQ